MHEEHILRLIESRKAGLTPAQVAKQLGLRAAEVKKIIKEHGSNFYECERIPFEDVKYDVPGIPKLLECLVLENWQEVGLTAVLLRRKSSLGYGIATAFLVDVWCLGVKNVMCPSEVSRTQFERLLENFFLDKSLAIQVSIPFAREIVFGAMAYARGLGFEPHPDFSLAVPQLGEHAGPISLEFGHKGKPSLIAGPDDNADVIASKLRKAVGDGNFESFKLPDSIVPAL